MVSHNRPLFLIPTATPFLPAAFHMVIQGPRIVPSRASALPRALEASAFSKQVGSEGEEKTHLLPQPGSDMRPLCPHSRNPRKPLGPTQHTRAQEREQEAGEPCPGSKATLCQWRLKSSRTSELSVLLSQSWDSNPDSMALESILLTATLQWKSLISCR